MTKKQLKQIFDEAFKNDAKHIRTILLDSLTCMIEAKNNEVTVHNNTYVFEFFSLNILKGEIIYTAKIKDLENLVKYNDKFKHISLD